MTIMKCKQQKQSSLELAIVHLTPRRSKLTKKSKQASIRVTNENQGQCVCRSVLQKSLRP